jgi:serine protease
MYWQKLFASLALLLAVCAGPPCLARESALLQPHALDPLQTNRIIVRWRTTGVAAVMMERVEARASRLSGATGIRMSPSHNLFGRTDVMLLDHTPSHDEMLSILGRLNADPAVEYAEADAWRYLQDFPATLPNDPHFLASTDPSNAMNPDLSFGSWVGQWYLLPSSSTTPAAISATTAWQTATALGSGIVIAVIDSGVIQDHPDLLGKMQKPGYDFVSCDQGNFASTTTTALGATQSLDECSATVATYNFANDNQNWHADGSDPGDFIDANDATLQLFKDAGCTTVTASTWHGTKVAGVIGALTNNGIGIAGVAPDATLLSVRVTGKCKARASDVAAAILWAAGQPVTISTGPIAASPAAKIINISLGANSTCTQTEQDAINTALGAGVLVVAAAGNEGGAIDAPANCKGVASVVGLRHSGDKVPFSSLSSDTTAATIAAPAGNCVNTRADQACLYDIETTTDASQTTPSATPGFYTYPLLNSGYLNSGGSPENEANVGTSFATPMVAGVAALMLSVNPKLTPSQIIARLQSSATAFPTSSPGSSPTPPICTVASAISDSSGHFPVPATPAECICTTATCGAGMLNAEAAVRLAGEAFVQITASKTSASPGEKITLDGSGSTGTNGSSIVSYQWSTDPAVSDILTNANESKATLIVPSFRSITVTLTIVDSSGQTSSASILIESAIGAAAGRKGGGLEPTWLAALALLALWQLYRRRSSA